MDVVTWHLDTHSCRDDVAFSEAALHAETAACQNVSHNYVANVHFKLFIFRRPPAKYWSGALPLWLRIPFMQRSFIFPNIPVSCASRDIAKLHFRISVGYIIRLGNFDWFGPRYPLVFAFCVSAVVGSNLLNIKWKGYEEVKTVPSQPSKTLLVHLLRWTEINSQQRYFT